MRGEWGYTAISLGIGVDVRSVNVWGYFGGAGYRIGAAGLTVEVRQRAKRALPPWKEREHRDPPPTIEPPRGIPPRCGAPVLSSA